MTKKEHIEHLEKRLIEAKQLNDKSMVRMIEDKLKNMKRA